MQNPICPICKSACSLLDVVDFNKSCEEIRGKYLQLSGIPIYYAFCGQCGFCFAPEIYSCSLEECEKKIYNKDYIFVDPDYLEARPQDNANFLIPMFKEQTHLIKHLDYGGGNGILSNMLKKSGFNSNSYDPFVNKHTNIKDIGKFNLITAFEVFEHVPDIQQLMSNLVNLLELDGIILFSTLVSDGNIHPNKRLDWWYASPRNGHISLFSKHSLYITAQNYGFNFASFSEGCHVFFKEIPVYAKHIF